MVVGRLIVMRMKRLIDCRSSQLSVNLNAVIVYSCSFLLV